MTHSQPFNHDLPPVRACIFDMDGLLIDSEEIYTEVTNVILRENGRPDLPWEIKAKLQGRPGPQAGAIFEKWAQLKIQSSEFWDRQRALQADLFPNCRPLPGVEALLQRLATAKVQNTQKPVRLALATSSHKRNYDLKVTHMQPMMSVFPTSQRVLGDDERIPKGRGKPLPDIYLLALQTINKSLRDSGSSEAEIKPEECLVFEDSVPGIESGRRAGMRVVWVPHPGLLGVYKDRVPDVLAATTGEHDESELVQDSAPPLKGSPGNVGKVGDGWGEILSSLEDFDYSKYGMEVDTSKPITNMTFPNTTKDQSEAQKKAVPSLGPQPGLSSKV